ncbi:MAG: phosphoribosyltransferase [Acidimicrobiales bacterium]
MLLVRLGHEDDEPLYRDRAHAGVVLAGRLGHHAARPDVVVLALPRGGVPVGYEVARALEAPLEAFLVRKLGVPGHEEMAMGAVATGGVRVVNDTTLASLGITEEELDAVTERERRELQSRQDRYRRGEPALELAGKVAILVDDGLATGSSMRAAVAAVRHHQPARVVVAVPTGAAAVCEQLTGDVDELHCTANPTPFHAVGLSYRDFSQTSDEEVRRLLGGARSSPVTGPSSPD